MAHFLPPELVRQVNKLEWPKMHSLDNVNLSGGSFLGAGWASKPTMPVAAKTA